MVNASKPARQIYDELIGIAPLGRCPFCGVGYASTLDHYLPKTTFPWLSIVPINLIPSCKDCNTGKSTNVAATAEEQPLHPYYDHDEFISEQWLFAEVQETIPATIRFFVNPPVHWNDISKQRVQAHFNDFNLSKRFSIEAANELTSISSIILEHISARGLDEIRNHLNMIAITESQNYKNSWKTAMYQSLSASNWYCEGGYAEK